MSRSMWRNSRRVWSLLDIMRKAYVSDILVLYHTMILFKDFNSFSAPRWLDRFLSFSRGKAPDWHKKKIIQEEDRKSFDELYAGYENQCLNLGLMASAATLRKMRSLLLDARSTYGEFWGFGAELEGRLFDEVENTFFLALNTKEAGSYRHPLESWGDVSTKYPEAIYEIDEAAKCLAVGRSTAAVFHLMRTMEIGIRAAARCLEIPDPISPQDRSWGKIQEKIKKNGIEVKWPTVSSRHAGDGAFFEAIYASLDAVKNPWRNATMHVEKKYTEEEAEEIFNAVKAFMKKLASRCDEEGKPHA